MSEPLRNISNEQVGDQSCYKTDVIFCCNNENSYLEVLLLETSREFDKSDNIKLNFDFHKGIFVSIAMFKTVDDDFKYALL
ncbi:hypothetical protein BDA99DRAFT_438328 [Phascolomyces articulosus]|uniref:Uncharacterized protein n=1 Tax=Phascolomyces articulosus TaxID=60185 RepID=A0AAD5K0L4_9FUNG|nr:hypothetical protein BDA99DRAFT_438328 [Phascolomyces articulosus]